MTNLTGDGRIYKQHEAAFNQVAAYVVMRGPDRVATIAIKYPRDGAGRLYAYVHWIGVPMVRGWAGGGGYDKRSAAIAGAARRMTDPPEVNNHWPAERTAAYDAFRAACAADSGRDWSDMLRDVGFAVYQAV